MELIDIACSGIEQGLRKHRGKKQPLFLRFFLWLSKPSATKSFQTLRLFFTLRRTLVDDRVGPTRSDRLNGPRVLVISKTHLRVFSRVIRTRDNGESVLVGIVENKDTVERSRDFRSGCDAEAERCQLADPSY